MIKVIKIFSLLFLFSCNGNNETLESRIDFLKNENDSLKSILNEVNNKYVFDSISVREIRNEKNTKKINSSFKTDIVVVGYGINPYFIKYDSVIGNKLINPDTLKHVKGSYKLDLLLDKKENPLKINMFVKNKYGKSKQATLHNLIKVK